MYFVICYFTLFKIPLYTIECIYYRYHREEYQTRDHYTFNQDQRVKSQANLADYANSGFDRGHAASYANYRSTFFRSVLTFMYTNVFPMNGSLNSGPWETIERFGTQLSHEIYNATREANFSGRLIM